MRGAAGGAGRGKSGRTDGGSAPGIATHGDSPRERAGFLRDESLKPPEAVA